MIPYNILNTIISIWDTGFPFAAKIRDVTPIKDAIKVKKLSRSKRQNAVTIIVIEPSHNASSPFVK